MEINLATDLRPYESDAEFLLDQLQLLDERINLYLARKNRRLDIDGKNFYRGLVLSEKEFSELMAENNFDEELKLQINQMESQVLLGEVYIQRRVALTAEYGSELKTNKVLNKFNLGNFEKQCVFIALAVELDSKYEKVFAYLQNDVERRNPTIGLVLELLSKSKEEQLRNRSFFAEDAKLMKYFFAPGEDKNLPSFLTRALKLNPDMVNYLLEWEPSPTVGSPPTPLLYNQEILDNITTILAREKQVIICLEGKHGTGKT
ncbi:MAG: hypothetical protein GXW85_10590 [Clostridia bacterium]|nr:hypothetical protein [Clostridia bacterium]